MEAVENKANPEEIHSRLESLLFESISLDITLIELLDMLSSSCVGGTKPEFIGNVSSHYAASEASAKVLDDEKVARIKAKLKKANKTEFSIRNIRHGFAPA